MTAIKEENIPTLRSFVSTHILRQNLEYHVPFLSSMIKATPSDDRLLSESPRMQFPTNPETECLFTLYKQNGLNMYPHVNYIKMELLRPSKTKDISCFGKLEVFWKNQLQAVISKELNTQLCTPKNIAKSPMFIIAYVKFEENAIISKVKIRDTSDDYFTLRCNLNVINSFEHGLNQKRGDRSNQTLLCALKNLWQAEIGESDVVNVKFGNKHQYKAHKSILSARSPVFAAMFKHDTKEKKSNAIDIQDIDGSIFHLVLQFIYANDIDEKDWTEENACKLLPAADKYMLQGLKEKCEELFIEKLTFKNCGQYLKLGDAHSADRLKFEDLQFVKSKLQMNSVPRALMDKLSASPDYCRMLGDLVD